MVPVVVRYGCSLRVTFGFASVTWMISRFWLARNSAEVGMIASGIGFTVTVVETGAEAIPALFLAVMLTVTVVGVSCVAGRIGARKVMVAPVPGGLGPW